jgi:RNA polymerase sigma-70 factor (ECF subfamily)
MAPTTDGELWRAAQAGDAEAFGVLFDRHAEAIYTYCFRRTADWALAEDLTSVVFFEAWRKRKAFVPAGNAVLPWLYGVALNVVRNQRRSRRRYEAALGRMPALEPERDFADDLVDRLVAEQRMRRLLEALRELPEAEQEALVLCAWQGLTAAEAAVALGVPEATVRTRLFRARGRLQGVDEPAPPAVDPDSPGEVELP